MTGPALRWHILRDAEQAVGAVVVKIAEEAERAVAARGRFSVVLSGGSTPKPIYAAVRELEASWSRWHVYFTDERCLPAGDPGRNDTMALATWLDRVAIPRDQIHRIPAELGPEQAATLYAQTLARVDRFDLVLLGLGEDGHTASLFPGRPEGVAAHAPDAVAVHAAPKLPADRVSMSAARLARAESVVLVVIGAAKREALVALRNGAAGPLRPIVPEQGIDVFADSAASGAS